MPTAQQPERVAIIGGGMAALAAAAELVRAHEGRGTQPEITIYSLGWRLGGKGASARNRSPGMGMRIEEHGLHVWFGCYHKAWNLLQHCYDQLDRHDDMGRLFQGQTDTPYMEDVGGWKVWPVHFPRRYGTLGQQQDSPDDDNPLHGMLHLMLEWLGRLGAAIAAHPQVGTPAVPAASPAPAAAAAVAPLPGWGSTIEELIERIEELAQWLEDLLKAGGEIADDLRRLGILFDLGMTTLKGLWADDVLKTGFDALDHEDARAWFRRHGANEVSLNSAPIRALYDLCFAYRGGAVSWDNADFAAGAALVTVLRIALEYPDYVVYEMRAGMGEVVIAPIYQFLKQNGVKFAFFHQATSLELSDDGSAVTAVNFMRQAEVAGGIEYDPLFWLECPADGIPGLFCWPSEPKYELLVNGDALRGVNLESAWSGWPGVGTVRLEAGTHFDRVVLGVSLDSARELCASFPAKLPAWGTMFGAMQTVQTASAQLWMNKTLQDLGWTHGAVPIDAGPEPMDVWADRSDVLPREVWTQDPPLSLHYLCGPLDERWAQGLPRDPDFPKAGLAAATTLTIDWLNSYAGALWPTATRAAGGFDWNVLRDPSRAVGEQRLASQYLRANIDPSERYVLSVAGSSATRLKADGAGPKNLVLTGDWTHNDWNAGCIEAAVTTGWNAAQVLLKPPPA